tara:strand:+ start:7379 stop:7825 length:447 start_codon:yes stop_codon:yes gene_type:complete
MSIQEQIDYDLKQAMKEKNADKLAALRAVKSAIMLEITKSPDVLITDEVSLNIIARLVKQRKDAAAIFIEQNRQDLADEEIIQSSYLEGYLPVQLDEDEVRKIVKEVILYVGALSLADISKCMKILMKRLNGKADGALISRLVREQLS